VAKIVKMDGDEKKLTELRAMWRESGVPRFQSRFSILKRQLFDNCSKLMVDSHGKKVAVVLIGEYGQEPKLENCYFGEPSWKDVGPDASAFMSWPKEKQAQLFELWRSLSSNANAHYQTAGSQDVAELEVRITLMLERQIKKNKHSS